MKSCALNEFLDDACLSASLPASLLACQPANQPTCAAITRSNYLLLSQLWQQAFWFQRKGSRIYK